MVPGADLSAHGRLVHQHVPGPPGPGRRRPGGRVRRRPRRRARVKAVKEQLRAVPDKGIGYGLLRYLNPETAAALAGCRAPQIGFNYLGRSSGADIPERLRGWAGRRTPRTPT